MRYHVPPDATWNAEAVSLSLRAQSRDAVTSDDSIQMRVTLPAARNRFARLFWTVFSRRPLLITIRINDARFVANVTAEYDVLRAPLDFEWMEWMDSIDMAMKNSGYFVLDSIDDERKIAHHYLSDACEVDKLYDELGTLYVEWEKQLDLRDYVAATKTMARIDELRDQADEMLTRETSL